MRSLRLPLALLLLALPVSASAKVSFCGGKRLTIMNYVQRYHRLMKELRRDPETKAGESLLGAISRAGGASNDASEVCRWNRFFFLDTVLYFGQTADLGATRIEALQARDRLYQDWLQTLNYRQDTGFAEWEKKDLRGESLEKFLSRGSQQFRLVEWLGKPFNRSPGDSGKPLQIARRAVHSMLDARTPFNSLLPRIAVADLGKPETARAVACVRDRVRDFDCRDNLYDQALECSGGSEPLALEVMGVYASQRMYLLRDLKGWMEQNLPEDEFDRGFQTLKDGSEIYFLLETAANRCGGAKMLPRGANQALPRFSPKAYHFWSEADLAYRLGVAGFDHDVAVKAALEPARRYKSLIRLPGILFNLLLGRPLKDGTVGDYKQVLAEQNLGAEFGFAAYERTNP